MQEPKNETDFRYYHIITVNKDITSIRRGSRIPGRGGGGHRERRKREALLGGSAQGDVDIALTHPPTQYAARHNGSLIGSGDNRVD